MKPQPQLKTLTLTLALTTAITASSTFGYNAVSTEAKKAAAFAEALDAFLYAHVESPNELKHPQSVSGAGTEESPYEQVGASDVMGTFTAKGGGAVTNLTNGKASKITNGRALTEPELANLYKHAAVLENPANKTAVLKVFTANTTNEPDTNVTAIKTSLNKIDTDFDMADNGNVAKASSYLNAVKGGTAGVVTTSETAIAKNYSEEATSSTKVDAIDALNQAITSVNSALEQANLPLVAQRQAFFNYAVAYLDYKDIKPKDINIPKTITTVADDSKLTPLAKQVLSLIDNQSNIVQFFAPIATDDQLDDVIGLSADELQARVTTLDNALLKTSLVKALNGIEDADTANKIVAKITPDANINANLIKVASKVVINNIATHMHNLQAGVNSGDDDYIESNIWLRTSYLRQNVDAKDNSPGYKQKSLDAGIGIEQVVNVKYTFGLAYNFVTSDIDGKDDYGKQDEVKSHAVGVYANILQDNWFIDAQINHINNRIDGFHGAIDDKVTYQYGSKSINAMLATGMHLDLANHWYAEPKLCLAFASYETNDYNEVGNGARNVHAVSNQSAELGLQLAVGADLIMEGYTLTPQFNCGFMYDFNNKRDKVSFNLMGVDMISEGIKPDHANFNLGLGADIMMDKLTINLDYGFNFSSNTKTHLVSAKVGYMF